MHHAAALHTILFNDPLRWRALECVRSLDLPDCWIGAGFIREAVWDHLHGRPGSAPSGDVDVLWFGPTYTEPSLDRELQTALQSIEPCLNWSVKNQARMHTRNRDMPYASVLDAMFGWPETATSVAVQRTAVDHCKIAAPFGLDDLFTLVLRPTPRFNSEKHPAYLHRVHAKRWLTTWPRLRMESGNTKLYQSDSFEASRQDDARPAAPRRHAAVRISTFARAINWPSGAGQSI